jgi:H3 lysine-79-specific histone-lysine N-methyltransferase
VYGETSFELVAQMLDLLNLNPNDSFVDLGSGVGQVVLQVASGSNCGLSIGIEVADIPSAYAELMGKTFQSSLQWFGRSSGHFELKKGDFLSEQYKELIQNASVIFVNNIMFGSQVEHQLKQIFLNLRDGTRIVSSKKFCPINSRVTNRNSNDLESILDIMEFGGFEGSVGWTSTPVSFYLHVVNRTKLVLFLDSINSPEASGGVIVKKEISDLEGEFHGWESGEKKQRKRRPRKSKRQRLDTIKESDIETQIPSALDVLLDSFR